MHSNQVAYLLMLTLAQSACGEEPERTAPTLAACDLWAERKLDACREEVQSAPVPNGAAPKLRALTLYDQCVLFDDRREALHACVAAPSCEAFAGCTMSLAFDAWSPAASPSVCTAFLRRKAGAESDELDKLLQARNIPERRGLMSALYRLHESCDQPQVRARLAECLSLEDAGFASCIVDLAKEQPDVPRTQEAAQP